MRTGPPTRRTIQAFPGDLFALRDSFPWEPFVSISVYLMLFMPRPVGTNCEAARGQRASSQQAELSACRCMLLRKMNVSIHLWARRSALKAASLKLRRRNERRKRSE